MPPSHHSSSSHRSSSSSHRSSGPSYHSHSSSRSSYSHSSGSLFRSSSSFSHSGSSHRSVGGTSTYDSTTGFTRTRKNQPTGFVHSGSGFSKPYHCMYHDYMYYSQDWSDTSSGKSYKKGFYDETGKYYKNVTVKDTKNKTLLFRCEYCGTEVKSEWESGEKPTCPNCNAQLVQEQTDELVKTSPFDQFDYTPRPEEYSSMGEYSWIVKLLVAVVIIAVGCGFFSSLADEFDISRVINNSSSSSAINSFYVPELGRSCDWVNPYESYYDKTTDCYFWYNDTIEYPDWQYWYEGISSDYGEYGWMEYEVETDTWFIETDNGVWEELPAKYSRGNLWHTTALPEGK